jgi:hypothetical protein
LAQVAQVRLQNKPRAYQEKTAYSAQLPAQGAAAAVAHKMSTVLTAGQAAAAVVMVAHKVQAVLLLLHQHKVIMAVKHIFQVLTPPQVAVALGQ